MALDGGCGAWKSLPPPNCHEAVWPRPDVHGDDTGWYCSDTRAVSAFEHRLTTNLAMNGSAARFSPISGHAASGAAGMRAATRLRSWVVLLSRTKNLSSRNNGALPPLDA
jgi:hypothetical protein